MEHCEAACGAGNGVAASFCERCGAKLGTRTGTSARAVADDERKQVTILFSDLTPRSRDRDRWRRTGTVTLDTGARTTSAWREHERVRLRAWREDSLATETRLKS